jgi:aminopeptidase N
MKVFSCLFLLFAIPLGLSAQFNCQETKSSFAPALSGTSIDYNSRSDTFDIIHTNLVLDVRSFLNVIGEATIEVAVLQDASNLRFDLLNLQVDSAKVEGSNFQSSQRQNPFINLIGNYQAGDTLLATIYYRGNPPTDPSGWGGWHRTPNLAFNLGVGFGSNPHVFGRSLFPCFDNFVEHSTYTTSILTSSGQVGISNGIQSLDSTGSLGRYTRWELTDPIPSYLYALAVADFKKLSSTHNALLGTIDLEVYAQAGDTANARQSFRNLPEILDAYEHYFGPYVWQRVGYVLTTIGAMEHSTSIHFPRNLIDGSLGGEDIIAHELAHHWFGNLITCERAEDMWINEGWAEFCSHLYEEYVYSRERYLSTVRANRDRVLRFAPLRDDGHRALVEMPQDYTYGEHTYQKGAMVAHNLRAYMGDSLFFGSLKQLFQQNDFENFSIPRFQQTLEQYSGLDLNNFFDDQIEQPGYTHFMVDSVIASPIIGGQRLVDVWIRQSLHAANHLYKDVPILLHLFSSDGQEEIHTIRTDTNSVRSHRILDSQLPDIAYTVIDLDGILLTAHSPEKKWANAVGSLNFSEALLQLNISQLNNDSSLLITEHHWVAPEDEVDHTLGWKLSGTHFWTVQGDLDGDLEAEAVLTYDGRLANGGLDADLLANGEDSIVLMYREFPWEEWEEYDNYVKDVQGSTLNKLGVMRISELKAGQYTFANGVSGISVRENYNRKDSLTLWPNPAKKEIQVSFPKRFKYDESKSFKLYDMTGRELAPPKHRFKGGVDILSIDVSALGSGTYWLDIQGLYGRFEKE